LFVKTKLATDFFYVIVFVAKDCDEG